MAAIGTTGTVAVDPLKEIATLCRQYNIWLHVDAAYAGSALLLPEYRWMIEGIAIAADGWCREYSVDEIALYLLNRGELPPFDEFFERYATLGEVRGGIYAASIIGFIQQKHGTDKSLG